ncbi:MAG: response regulator [Pyrinomonadaceae bacterium]|nr:response regulator [Pyrinomonadaceae bacterium]
MSTNPNPAGLPKHPGRYQSSHIVLVVEDHQDPQSELKEVLVLNGFGVIGTDNGQDAARHARRIRPDLLLIDLDVPLLFELVAARQILKQAQLWHLPVVIVTHEAVIDPWSIMEVGARRNEYVTRLSDYDQLQDLLDYLLPVLPPASTIEIDGSHTFRTNGLKRLEGSISPNVFQPT